ncbi:flagellar hook-basal body complex protein [Thalassobius sp. MITS945101]|uniref:flagellar hook-basal body complex protein n=1 Tax=Thalassobius sp. MITS945101 TaxID=3096994 RepID=UPI00399A888B
MDNANYATLTRQHGLLSEMQVIANNIANMATTGFRQEGLIFAEHVARLAPQDGLSMATASVPNTSAQQGALTQTNGSFDLAIEGPGYFLVETPLGPRMTRAGAFVPSATGELMTPDGYLLLDTGETPVFVPPGARSYHIAPDGTLSADGAPTGQIGVFQPLDPLGLRREDGVMFASDGGFDPVLDPRMVQGFLEQSNVDPISQIARMIEVQRAYEMGQNFLKSEDERIRRALEAMSR